MTTIIVTGSLAYDRIMDFPGYFSDHILPEKIHVLNVCFQVNGMKENFGGTAGNIAYALTRMGNQPVVSAALGHDGDKYLRWLRDNGIATDHIRTVDEEFTAGAYITTDRGDNQITGFNPGAMKYSSNLDLSLFPPQDTLVIVSPGNLDDMVRYPAACRERGVPYVFDPGQSLPVWEKADLIAALDGSRLLIANDYEIDLIMNKTGLNMDALLRKARAVIVTLGEKGSRVCFAEGKVDLPSAKADRVDDPTGAGDAYRGGLLSGLARGMDLTASARLGAVCASFAVEHYGTQVYSFTPEAFAQRLAALGR